MSASPPGLLRHWRATVAVMLSAAAGAGLRTVVREHGGMSGAKSRQSLPSDPGTAPQQSLSGKAKSLSRPSVELLLRLPVADRVLAVAEWLPSFSAAEISMLVRV